MFRDESDHVIRKAEARAARKKARRLATARSATPSETGSRVSATSEPKKSLTLVVPPTPATSCPSDRDAEHEDDTFALMSPDSGCWPVTPAMAQIYNIDPELQEKGFAYFFSRYVTNEETVSHQKFDFLRDVWRASSSARDQQVDVVLASMVAVGLMGMASTNPTLMDAAHKAYGTALRLINHALQDPVEAVKDITMLSVLILGLFEMMAETTPRTLTVEAFQEHVNGAVALASLRGASQFKTRAGRRMFSMLCQRAIISCAQRNQPMPEALQQLWHEMTKSLDKDNPNKRLMPLVWQVLQLRAEINSGELSSPQIIVDRLLALEDSFEKLTAQLPSSWAHRTLKVTQHHPAVFGGICHLHSTLHHANLWNSILTIRIMIFESIKAEISRDLQNIIPSLEPTVYLPAYHDARRKLKHLVPSVAYSVPQQLGLINPTDGTIDSKTPIATVEIRATPSPPTSPSARSDLSNNAAFFSTNPSRSGNPFFAGPTIFDLTLAPANAPEEEAARYMHLASAKSTAVWPLFVAGMSSACSAELRAYVVGRLRALCMETGARQADALAAVVEERGWVLGHPEEVFERSQGSEGLGLGLGLQGMQEQDGQWIDLDLEAALRGMEGNGSIPEVVVPPSLASPSPVPGLSPAFSSSDVSSPLPSPLPFAMVGCEYGLGLAEPGRELLRPEFDAIWA